jgi:hypothetical protein
VGDHDTRQILLIPTDLNAQRLSERTVLWLGAANNQYNLVFKSLINNMLKYRQKLKCIQLSPFYIAAFYTDHRFAYRL